MYQMMDPKGWFVGEYDSDENFSSAVKCWPVIGWCGMNPVVLNAKSAPEKIDMEENLETGGFRYSLEYTTVDKDGYNIWDGYMENCNPGDLKDGFQ